MEKTWTIIDVLNWGKSFFEEKDVDSPRLSMELILCHVLGLERIDIYTHFDKPLNTKELAEIKDAVIARVKGKPVQHIIGKTSFIDYEIKCSSDALIPRPETELLADWAIRDYSSANPENILDIGTGSGCVAIALAARFTDSKVFAIDISNDALKLAKENADHNKLSNIYFKNVNILENTAQHNKFDIIVSNPPYIPLVEYEALERVVKDYEPKISLTDGNDGMTFYRRYADIFQDMLTDNGSFYIEVGHNQAEKVSLLFKDKGYQVECRKDLAGIYRMIKGKKCC